MNGKERAKILAEQERLLAKAGEILNEPVELIASCLIEEAKTLKPLECLAKSLALMATADYVIFGESWINARGCRIERTCAKEYGIQILDV